MMLVFLPWLVPALCLLGGLGAVAARPRALAGWIFLTGMSLLAAGYLLEWQVGMAVETEAARSWLWRSLMVKSLVPGVWLAFSLVYARGNGVEFLRRWAWALVAALVLPAAILLLIPGNVLELRTGESEFEVRLLPVGKLWVVALLLLSIAVLANLEKTFRASVGMMRWRIKYLILGAALIFGVHVYSFSQVLLFATYDPALARLGTVGLAIGCLLIIFGHTRSSFENIDLYPSRAVLQGSLTVILAGGYFVIVGLLAQLVKLLGGAGGFPAQALVLLLGIVGLTVLLLSDRFRTGLQRFVSRHFRRAEHDFRKIWTEFTRRTANAMDAETLATHAAQVISECFHVLGVNVFQVTDGELTALGSTERKQEIPPLPIDADTLEELAGSARPFDLENRPGEWAAALREHYPRQFGHGGNRMVVPLAAADRLVGLAVLSDRVNGIPYSHEELDLLNCIGDQLASGLLNCSLTETVLQARELEAFQTLSTFFVHDLKNAANGLSLTLQNLPIHFDDPEFRADAIRSVARSVERINQMILKLSRLRQELQLRREPCRLDQLCAEVLNDLEKELAGCELVRDLQPLPEIALDREAIRSVVINLVVNAREAMTEPVRITVATFVEDGRAGVRVADDGCGMSPDFIRHQLFRPFHSTKTKGLGIGMFQCKKIVEAHGGSISVASETGVGTCFTVLLPLDPSPPSL